MNLHFTPQSIRHASPILSKPGRLVQLPTPSVAATVLALPFPHGRRSVPLSQLIRLEGVGNYTNCHFLDGSRLLVALSLKVLAQRVPAGAFVRSHRKHLINTQYIEAVSAADADVLLTNGERIPLARRRVTGFRKMWQRG